MPRVASPSALRHLSRLPDIFLSGVQSFLDVHTSLYRPLVLLLWMLCHHLFGPAPWAFHLINALLHAGVCVMILLVSRRLLREERGATVAGRVAVLVAILFAVHPVHVEAVAWVSAVTDVSYGFFYLLAFYLYLRAVDKEVHVGWLLWLSALVYLAGMLCKEPAATLPLLVIIHDHVFRRAPRPPRRRVTRYGPYAAALAIYLALRIHALGGLAPVRNTAELAPLQYVLSALALFAQYLLELVLSVNLNNWHVFRPVESLSSAAGMIALLTALGFAALLGIAPTRSRSAALSLWLMVVPLLPALYIPGLTQGLDNAFAERYLYVPSYGYVLLLGILAERAWNRYRRGRLLVALAVVLVLGTYTTATVTRIRVWRNSLTLWSDAVAKSPDSAGPDNALAGALRQQHRFSEAVEHYARALELSPNSAVIHAHLAAAYAEMGQEDMAVRHLETAIRLRPDDAEPHNNLGVLQARMGHVEAAVQLFQTALRLKARMASTHNNLALALSRSGRADEAVAHYMEALRIDPDYADAHVNLGVALGEMGHLDQALEHFEAAVALNPTDAVALHNLGNVYRLKGAPEKAAEYLRRAAAAQQGSGTGGGEWPSPRAEPSTSRY